MISSLTHEMRTPLICSISLQEKVYEILISNASHELANLYLSPSIVSSKLLLNFINDILDYSALQAGKFNFVFKKFNLYNLVKSVMSLVEIQAEIKGIKLSLVYDTNLPATVKSDENRLRQILINLLGMGKNTLIIKKKIHFLPPPYTGNLGPLLLFSYSAAPPLLRTHMNEQRIAQGNALKFTKEGCITLKLQQLPESKILVSVQDTGIGISKENQKQLFTLFGKINSEKESLLLNQQGTGLGLVISNQLALGLGSQETDGLEVESEKG